MKFNEKLTLQHVGCRQTKPEINILFAVCGFSLSVVAGTNWEIRYQNPVQNFNGIVWVLYFVFTVS